MILISTGMVGYIHDCDTSLRIFTKYFQNQPHI